jgi:hypothetical protein
VRGREGEGEEDTGGDSGEVKVMKRKSILIIIQLHEMIL